MDSDQFEIIAENAKKIFRPAREKCGEDTTQLCNFIDDIAQVYEKHFDAGLDSIDAGKVLVQISIGCVMKNETTGMQKLYAGSVQEAGKIFARAIEQHAPSPDPKDWIMD